MLRGLSRFFVCSHSSLTGYSHNFNIYKLSVRSVIISRLLSLRELHVTLRALPCLRRFLPDDRMVQIQLELMRVLQRLDAIGIKRHSSRSVDKDHVGLILQLRLR